MTSLTIADVIRKYGLEAFSVLGALIGLSFIERLTLVAAGVAFAAGFGFAVVSAPIAVHYIAPPAEIRDYVLAGFAGLFSLVGFVVCGAIYASAQHLKTWLPEFVRKAIERKAGG
jgi:hypothetical protein